MHVKNNCNSVYWRHLRTTQVMTRFLSRAYPIFKCFWFFSCQVGHQYIFISMRIHAPEIKDINIGAMDVITHLEQSEGYPLFGPPHPHCRRCTEAVSTCGPSIRYNMVGTSTHDTFWGAGGAAWAPPGAIIAVKMKSGLFKITTIYQQWNWTKARQVTWHQRQHNRRVTSS